MDYIVVFFVKLLILCVGKYVSMIPKTFVTQLPCQWIFPNFQNCFSKNVAKVVVFLKVALFGLLKSYGMFKDHPPPKKLLWSTILLLLIIRNQISNVSQTLV